MGTDFSSIAKSAAGKAKKPPTLPPGVFQGPIKKFEWGDANKNKTPYVRLFVGFTSWPEDLGDTWEEFDNETQTSSTVNKSDVDLATRQMSRDFYMTEDSRYRMDELLRSFGIDCGSDDNPRTYEETLPELIGQMANIEVVQQINPSTNKQYTQIAKLGPVA